MWSRLRRRPRATAVEPDRALQSREELARLREILADLDEAKRDAFVLRVIEKLSLAESAAILDASVATVSYRARRAEAIVREAFERGTK